MAVSALAELWTALTAGPRPPVVHHPDYRLPLTSLLARTGLDPRRPDLALWWLLEHGGLRKADVALPDPATWADLLRVHTAAWLQALHEPDTVAQVLAVEAWDVDVDALWRSLRRIVGGTVHAARLAVERRGPVVQLAGGMHHAHPGKGAGFCPVNDLAVAVAALRHDGFAGRIGILDLDAHPPDGTLACMRHLGERIGAAQSDTAWLGSLSGCDWGPLPGADETVLPVGCGDQAYLAALDGLLDRMPACEFALVVAGGDVVRGDPLGRLGLSLAGCRQRDARVASRLREIGSVWLPAGGYGQQAWQVLAQSWLAVARRDRLQVDPNADPLAEHARLISESLDPERLGQWSLDLADVEAELTGRAPQSPRLLGYYTAAGLEFGLSEQGLFGLLERLGYRDLRADIAPAQPGDRLRISGRVGDDAIRHVLVELVVERARRPEGDLLFVHWLELRHPKGAFHHGRPPLPGQSVPGLGMAREASELLVRMAARLGLHGVALRPAWFHVAYTGRQRMRFADPARQGRFVALVRDLTAMPQFADPMRGFALAAASRAVAEGQIGLSRDRAAAEVYRWEPDEFVQSVAEVPEPPEVALEAASVRFVPL